MDAVFLKVVNMSLTASWLVLAVILLRLILKKAPKALRCVLWAFVGVRLICPFSFESALSLIPSAQPIPQTITTDTVPTINSGVPAVNAVVNPVLSQSFAPTAGESANPLQVFTAIAAVLWLVGIAVLLIYAAVSFLRVRRQVSARLHLRDNVYVCDGLPSPFILGIFRARIYLPTGLDDTATAHILAHEQAHLRRRDHWWKPLGFLLLTVHWFNPLMWVAYILLCRDIELACDEKVARTLDEDGKATYSRTLLACGAHRRVIAACPLAFGEVGVKTRVKSVLNYKKPAFWIILVAVIASLAVAVGFLTNPLATTNDKLKVFIDVQIAERNTVRVRDEVFQNDFSGQLITDATQLDELDVSETHKTYYYDNAFFAENALLVLEFRTTSGSDQIEIDRIQAVENRLNVYYTVTRPNPHTNDMAYWRTLIEVSKDDVQHAENVVGSMTNNTLSSGSGSSSTTTTVQATVSTDASGNTSSATSTTTTTTTTTVSTDTSDNSIPSYTAYLPDYYNCVVNTTVIVAIEENHIIVDAKNYYVHRNDSRFNKYDRLAFNVNSVPNTNIQDYQIGDKVHIVHRGAFTDGEPPQGWLLGLSKVSTDTSDNAPPVNMDLGERNWSKVTKLRVCHTQGEPYKAVTLMKGTQEFEALIEMLKQAKGTYVGSHEGVYGGFMPVYVYEGETQVDRIAISVTENAYFSSDMQQEASPVFGPDYTYASIYTMSKELSKNLLLFFESLNYTEDLGYLD